MPLKVINGPPKVAVMHCSPSFNGLTKREEEQELISIVTKMDIQKLNFRISKEGVKMRKKLIYQ